MQPGRPGRRNKPPGRGCTTSLVMQVVLAVGAVMSSAFEDPFRALRALGLSFDGRVCVIFPHDPHGWLLTQTRVWMLAMAMSLLFVHDIS